MKAKRLQLMIMATLFLGVNVGGAVTAEAATVQNKSAVVAKKTTPSKVTIPKSSMQKKSIFRPLVTKPVPKPAVTQRSISKANSATVKKATAAKPSAKSVNANTKSSAAKVQKSSDTNSIAANADTITRNKVGTVVTSSAEHKVQVPNVRVLLGSRTQDATVKPTSDLVVLNSANGQVSQVGANRGTTIGLRGGKIAVNGKPVDSVVTLKPSNSEAPFLFEGKSYRGGLTLRANNGTMMIINLVPLEEYLYGVVAQEAVPSWPAAALEAQAVAARTYALHTMEQNKGKLYDVSPTTDHQVYAGVAGESAATTNAVRKTKGIVMLYNQRPINALFHSDGGGYTEDSANVWGNDIPYLKGVKDYSTGTSTSNWTVTTSRQALESKLNAASKGVGKLKSIQLTPLGKPGKETFDRGVSGRIKSATFIGTSGKTTVDGDSLRNILGLKSTLFDFYVNHNPEKGSGKAYHNFTGKNDTVYIKGHGWGHGLGMSQWGAAEMAKQAKPGDANYYQIILRHYYSGITLKKMY